MIKKKIFWAVFTSGLLLQGCAYEDRARTVEQSALISPDGTVSLRKQIPQNVNSIQSNEILLNKATTRTAVYALRLSDAYKALGDEAARNRDLSVLGLISLAGAAALGNASALSASDVALVLAAGAAVNEGVKYVNPGGAAEAFYGASESMACASVKIAKHYGSTPDNKDLHASYVALWYIRRIELLLRADLQREVPDFSSVLKRLGVGTRDEEVSAILADGGTPAKVELLQSDLDTCIREASGAEMTADQSSSKPEEPEKVPDLPDVEVQDG
jgi:hypothetical protein